MLFSPFRQLSLLVLAAAPGLALAEPISAKGYTAGCGEEGCFIASGGYLLFASSAVSDPDLLAGLAELPLISAVAFDGDMTNVGDSTADLALTAVSRIEDDLYEGNLQAMQGEWTVPGAGTPFIVNVSGMVWQEIVQDEVVATFALSVGEECANGVVPGGMAIVLYKLGDDPDADACWQVEYVDEATMVLRDFFGDLGQIEWVRP